MLFEALAKLFRTQPKRRPARRRSQHVSVAQLEILENREMLSATVATGYGTFQYAEDLASDFGGKVVDINNDSALDVVGDSVHIRSGDGWLTFADGPGVGRLVDIDGDNDLDVVRNQYWVENLGGGTSWAQHVVDTIDLKGSGFSYISSDAGDFDNDGDMDIVVSVDDWVYWHENVNGDGSEWVGHEVWRSGVFDFVSTAVADMDNDGDQDIVIGTWKFNILWAENNGSGSFSRLGSRVIGDVSEDGDPRSAYHLEVGDFDQDGRTDLFAVGESAVDGAINWFTPKDDPTERFRKTVVDRIQRPDRVMTAVDLDNDGELELVIGSRRLNGRGANKVFVYERTSPFSFTQVVLSDDWQGAVIDTGDLDNDGDIDLVGQGFISWNTGGDFHVETTDISPTAIANDSDSAVLKIDATHNGQDGDEDIFLTSFSFMVDDGMGEVGSSPLNNSTINSLFDNWKIHLDNGDGSLGIGDSFVVSVVPNSDNGVVRVDLTAAASSLRRLNPGQTRSYLLEVEMAARAHEFGDFRITNLTDLGILAGTDASATDVSGDIEANNDYSPNVSATLESAGNISFSLNTATLNQGTFDPSTVVDLLRIDATHTGLVDGELASLAFRFDDAAGTRELDSLEVNGLVEYLSIVAEDDSEVIRIENLSLHNGVLIVNLPDGDSRLNFLNETKSFRVNIQVSADAINQATRSFKITHLTADSNTERSSVELTSNDAPATLVSTPDRSATIFTGTEIDVVVTSSISTPVTGQQVTYTIIVSNQHATTGASGIQVQGILPGNLLNIMLVDLQVSGGATSSQSIGTSLAGTWTDTLSLPQQSSVTYTLTGTLADLGVANRSMEPEFLVSGVSTTLPTALFDTNLDNNQASRSDLVRFSSTGTGEFVDSGVDLANLNGSGAERVNEIALGDIDGDGDIDAIVTRGASGVASYATVLFNDGTGAYTESSQDLGYSNFTGAVLGDFDRDGDLDLYLATSTGVAGVTDDTDRVYLNDGNGVFTQTSQIFNFLTEAVEMGDMDGDGDLDIVVSGPNQSYTLRNFALGLFGNRNTGGVLDNLEEMKLADVDGDGDLDVIGQKNGLQVYLNEGIYNYSAGPQITSDSVLDFEVGDIDNDGDVDILISKESYLIGPGGGEFDRYLQVIRRAVNNGDGSFSFSDTGVYGSFLDLELGDFDNDGDLDAFLVEEVYTGYDGNPEIYYPDSFVPIGVVGRFWSNNGSGGFSDSGQTLDYNVTPTSAYAYDDVSVTAADVNGDGSLDIVTGDFTAAKVWFNNVAPTLSVDNAAIVVERDAIATNTGGVFDSAYDSYTLAASIGTITDNGDGTWSWEYSQTSAFGTTTVTVSATDSLGSITEITFELVVSAPPAISTDNSSTSIPEGQVATNSGTFSHPVTGTMVSLSASIGTVTDNGDGTWNWSFDTTDGPDESQTVTITATEDHGLTSTISFNLLVNNQAPVISVDAASVTVNEGAAAFMTGMISDAGMDTVTLSASIGTVSDNGDGTWTWLFDTNDGPDDSQTVTITAVDSDGADVETSFELIVNNVGPVLSFNASSLLLFEGETATKSGTISDIDGVASFTASQGTIVLNPDGTWTWTDVASTSFGAPPQRVVLTAMDWDGAMTQRDFTLTVLNVPVTFEFDSSDSTVTVGETVTRTGTYDNPRNEPLNFWSNVGQFSDNGDGTFSWTWIAPDTPLTQDVLYTFADDDSASGGFFQITVTNNVAPTISLDNEVNSILELTILNVDQKVADIVITDDGHGTNDLSLAGADASYFVLSGTELFLKAGTVLDFETKATYTVDIQVDDASVGSTPDDTVTFTLNVVDVPEPPEVDVKLDLADVPSGNGVLFSNAALGGTAPSLTFTVENNGIGDLILQPISVPSGFTLTSANFTTNQIVTPGSSVNFSVQMNTDSSGVKSGALTFATNDSTAAEQAYMINLSGAVIVPTTSPTTVSSGALLIDDGDDGYFAPGNWTTFGAGYSGDGQYAKSHDGPDRAIWAFGGLSAGQFRVFITWQNGGDKADDVTVLVRDGVGGPVLSTNSIAENVAPLNDRYEGGRRFQLLDTVVITGTDLVVELVDNGTGKTIVADAVLIEPFTPPPATPEITVRETGDLMDGGTFTFDSVIEGGTRSATFTIRNDGSADIILQPASITGSAFSIRTGTNFDANQHLAPGASVTITVDVDASTAGSFNGMLSIPSNDGDENPFDLALLATVNPADAVSFIIDDGDPGFSLTGNWNDVTRYGYGADAKAISVTNSGTATWTFSGLAPGEYVVSTTWLNGSDRADAVNYVIHDGPGGSVLSTVPVNQKNAPTGDTYGGRKFQGLGSVTITGDKLVVVVNNTGTNGAVIADAVRIEAVTPPPNTPEVDVKQDTLTVLDYGSFNLGSANLGDPQLEKTFTVKNAGTSNLTLEPISVTGTGFSLVGANFTSGQVLAPNETATFTVGLSTATLGTFSGNVSFLNNDGDENPFNFELSGSINVAPPSGVYVIDDGDAGFTTTGLASSVATTAGYAGDLTVASASNGDDTARWEFTGLAAGSYDVALTWQRAGDRATSVTYVIKDGDSGVILDTVVIDQTLAPVGFTDNKRPFQILTNVAVASSLVIEMSTAGTTGAVIIDAARIQKTS
ncbi:MAG: FG-GAP-like repeat-containing protein [Planctomycetaceae bacterium]